MGGQGTVILLAADQVGLQISQFLAGRRDPIDWLILDSSNRGGCNDAIRQAVTSVATRIGMAESLNDGAFVSELAAARPRLGVLAWWPHLVKGPLLDVPELGWLNLHPGYLPYNRGKHPNFWCLVDGTPCGAALHFIDRGVDTGPVIARARIETGWEDTGETVHRKCRELAVQLFKQNFDAVMRGSARPAPQMLSEGTGHRSGGIETASEIDLDRTYTARQLLNVMRARMFPPHPSAFFRDGDKTYSVKVIIEERDRGGA
jgi:methionyl-tRNA formyltransferase